MAATEFVIMPSTDYQAICDKVREKTGGEELLKSGDIPSALENLSGEKILYMDAALLDAGGAYPADADDYTTAVIPAEATYVSLDAFDNLPNIDTVIINGDCEFETIGVYDSTSKATVYFNVFWYKGIPLKKVVISGRTEIQAHFCMDVATLREISVSGSIGDYAFAGCNYLKEAQIENSYSIGKYAFSNCKRLIEINIPEGVTSIGWYAFNRCESISELTLPNGLTTIYRYAFYGCKRLSRIVIPDSVTGIESDAFAWCTGLKEITFSKNIHTITSYICDGCTSLESVTFQEGNASIMSYAFRGCSSLTSVVLPNGMNMISQYAFQNCSNLTDITIPESVSVINTGAIPETTIIHGYAGSYAETWASDNGYAFEVITE